MEPLDELEEFKIPDEATERLKDPEVIRSQIEEGLTFQEVLGYQEEQMEKFYHVGYQLFQQQEYNKATEAFVFLTTLNPYIYQYWLGLGMSEQMIGNYQGALLAYAMAIMNNVEDPKAHYYSASCYRSLNDKECAINSLLITIRLAKEKEEYANYYDYARQAKEGLEKEK